LDATNLAALENNPREYTPVTATVNGVEFPRVAIKLKGAAGSFRPVDDRPAMTVAFHRDAPGRRLFGLRRLHLNNSVQDPSYLCEAVSRELFAAAGVPVPRVDHVTLLINGRDLGLYVLAEGWGRPFLRRHFANADGNLYDGGFLQEITAALDTNSGENRTDHAALDRLRAAVFEPDVVRRSERLAAALDLDRFFSFLAMEIMTCHWDGYAMNRNNYRLFHDRDRDRMVFLPHGLDQMFGVHRSSPTSPILPAMQGLVANAVLSLPGAPERLRDRIAALRADVFLPERLTNRVQELSRRLRPTLAAYAPEWAEAHDVHVAALCRRIVTRAASISAQLAGEAPVMVEEPRRQRVNRWPGGE
ncbi:partial Inner spore coat protein H, partial [Anaerolineae bacterium]